MLNEKEIIELAEREYPIGAVSTLTGRITTELQQKAFTRGYTQAQERERVWINTKERLPEDDGYHLVYSTAGVHREWFDFRGKYFGTNSQYQILATHWQPLPAPPSPIKK